jgi:hypothetical protein
MTAKRQEDLGVRVITAYANFRVGQVLFPPAMLRDSLIKRGFVEAVRASVDELPLERPAAPIAKPRSGKTPAAVTR